MNSNYMMISNLFARTPKIVGLLFLCASLSGCLGGAQFPDFQQMLVNLSTSFPPLWRMITALSYVFGMAFIMRGVYALKVYGEGRSMMSSQASMKVPLIYLIAGSALMFLPTMKSVLLASTFGVTEQTPLSYYSSNPIWNEQAVQVLLQIVQLVGLISFVRGWFFLAHGAQQGGQSTFGKAMTHIIGGIFAINIEGTREMFMATFGVGS
jgi:intracellular multiplication protein IcmC